MDRPAMHKIFDRLRREQRGATAVEYGLIVALIFLGAIVGISAFGSSAIAMWEYVASTSFS